MYCSSCGAAVAKGLSYCNQCGANLIGAKGGVTKPTELFPESLIWAIVSVFVIGLGCSIGLMAVMKDYGFSQLLIVAFTLLIFVLMLAVEGVFISLLFSRKSSRKEIGETESLHEQAAKELGAAQARALSEPVPSVTDHTTRAFEPIYSERKVEH